MKVNSIVAATLAVMLLSGCETIEEAIDESSASYIPSAIEGERDFLITFITDNVGTDYYEYVIGSSLYPTDDGDLVEGDIYSVGYMGTDSTTELNCKATYQESFICEDNLFHTQLNPLIIYPNLSQNVYNEYYIYKCKVTTESSSRTTSCEKQETVISVDGIN